ncbi:SDR family NAD(P)-dependent oxidoreductase [Parasphingopyxis algicola]|uniref:SDR family NAD(P)-dependent oxidoreductase n=1 Tax=Parasphingopyxis algicola TaxID=2026624 RepID=UPI00159FDA87|nr:SDR family NAD(P)-dependent oxidoreductase [Parasphingopyxis algicola]QLC24271.1 SDR family NAD(P)-dependent oxidoreductase [Parasphingopyxis algicola]
MHIVMTGATSGIGEEAAKILLERADVHLTIGSRSGASGLPQSERLTVLPLDMDSLENERRFADAVRERGPVDRLLLNAGLQLARPEKSADGFERTFAVNHLAHYLMLRLLTGSLAPGARVVLTGSGTHDPAENTPVTPPDHAEAEWLAYPERDPNPAKGTRKFCARAYSSSKLCNIMTAREFAARHPEFTALSYDPGYVPTTGLARDYPKWLMAIVSRVIPLLMARDRTSTVPRSGRYLADLAVDDRYARGQGDYWSVRGPDLVKAEPSDLARDAAAARKLWDDSARLVGLESA